MDKRQDFSLQSIGLIRTPYKDNFGIPKQSGLVRSDPSFIVLHEEFDEKYVEDLDLPQFYFLSFYFHETKSAPRAKVRPPRLGGNSFKSVFVTRSPYRPNSLGLSLVKILHWKKRGRIHLELSGADILDGTPLLDIRPFHHESDLPWTNEQKKFWFEEQTLTQKSSVTWHEDIQDLPANWKEFIEDALSLDPRPGHHHDDQRIYFVCYGPYEIQFLVSDLGIFVCEVKNL